MEINLLDKIIRKEKNHFKKLNYIQKKLKIII